MIELKRNSGNHQSFYDVSFRKQCLNKFNGNHPNIADIFLSGPQRQAERPVLQSWHATSTQLQGTDSNCASITVFKPERERGEDVQQRAGSESNLQPIACGPTSPIDSAEQL